MWRHPVLYLSYERQRYADDAYENKVEVEGIINTTSARLARLPTKCVMDNSKLMSFGQIVAMS